MSLERKFYVGVLKTLIVSIIYNDHFCLDCKSGGVIPKEAAEEVEKDFEYDSIEYE